MPQEEQEQKQKQRFCFNWSLTLKTKSCCYLLPCKRTWLCGGLVYDTILVLMLTWLGWARPYCNVQAILIVIIYELRFEICNKFKYKTDNNDWIPLTRNDQYAWPLQNTIILLYACFSSRSLFSQSVSLTQYVVLFACPPVYLSACSS